MSVTTYVRLQSATGKPAPNFAAVKALLPLDSPIRRIDADTLWLQGSAGNSEPGVEQNEIIKRLLLDRLGPWIRRENALIRIVTAPTRVIAGTLGQIPPEEYRTGSWNRCGLQTENRQINRRASDEREPRFLSLYLSPERQHRFLATLWPSLPVKWLWPLSSGEKKALIAAGVSGIGEIGRIPQARLRRILGSRAGAVALGAAGKRAFPLKANYPSPAARVEHRIPIDRETLYHRQVFETVARRLAGKLEQRLADRGLGWNRLKFRLHPLSAKSRYSEEPRRRVAGAAVTLCSSLLDEFEEAVDPGTPVRIASIELVASELKPAGRRQLDLMQREKEEKKEKLDEILRRLRRRFGEAVIRPTHGSGRRSRREERLRFWDPLRRY